MDRIQMDIASTVARIEQAYAERGTPLGELLLQRLATCDARRLRTHLTTEALDELAQANGESDIFPHKGRANTWDPLESTCRHASLSIL